MRPESVAPQSRSSAQPQRREPSASATQAVPSGFITQAGDIEPTTQPTQVFNTVSHTGVAPVQAIALAAVHCTQRPALRPEAAHAGVAPEQSLAIVAEHGRHMRRATSQMGVAPAQSALLVQPTQVLLAVSHTLERQSEFITHCTQRPALAPMEAQAGTPGSVQSAVTVAGEHGRQTRVTASHTGIDGSAQSRLETQATQMFCAVSQRGVAPEHCASVLQGTQRPALAPIVAQAGRVGSRAAHCASVLHRTQVRVAASHTGAPAPRVQSRSALQRHTPAVRSQMGAASGQLRSAAPGSMALVRPLAFSRTSLRQSLSESVSR